MKAKLHRAALRATARIAFGSGASGIVLGSSAWALGLTGCAGRALSDEPRQEAPPPVSNGAGNSGGSSTPSVGSGGTTGWTSGSGDSSRGGANSGGANSAGGELTTTGGSSTTGGEPASRGGTPGTGGEASRGGEASAGGVLSMGGEASTGGDAGGGPASGGASDTGSTGADAACVGPIAVPLAPTVPGPSEAEYACCLDRLATANADWLSEEGRALAQSEPISNCCRALIVAVDRDGSRYSEASRFRTPCCNADVVARPELYQHSLCTPWGPPMPPALDWQAV